MTLERRAVIAPQAVGGRTGHQAGLGVAPVQMLWGGTGVSRLGQAPFVCHGDLLPDPSLSWGTLYHSLQLWVLEMLCWPVSLPG